MKTAIIGPGKVGSCLALALKEQGFTFSGVAGRRASAAAALAQRLGCRAFAEPQQACREAELVLLTTPDDLIAAVCARIAAAGGFRRGQLVVHTSGVHSSAILDPAREQGALTASLHPLQSFAQPEASLRQLPQTVFFGEGMPGALPLLQKIVGQLGGRAVMIDTAHKALYHAAACVSCNYLVTLVDRGLAIMAAAGIDRREALPALLPLIEGTLNNIRNFGVPAALTGPIERGDLGTVAAHLQALGGNLPELLPLYRLLGKMTAQLAQRKGSIDSSRSDELINLMGRHQDDEVEYSPLKGTEK